MDKDMTKNEQKLLEIIESLDKSEINECLMKEKSKFLIMQLSHIRENIIEWIDFRDKKVLEINGEYGAVSEVIAKRARDYKVVIFDENQSEICASRLKDYSNTKIVLADKKLFVNSEESETSISDEVIFDTEFDYVIIANPFFKSKSELESVINSSKKILTKEGKIAIVLDNKYGLKYWAGAKEPNAEAIFSGIEGYIDYDGFRSFSRKEIKDALELTECKKVNWYYPYPDRFLPLSIYSDEYLPQKGELTNNIRGFGEDKMIPFDESRVFDNLIADGMFEYFSNSYMLLIEV